MARGYVLSRDQAEVLVELCMLTDNPHANDMASEVRELFGMVTPEQELAARETTIYQVRKNASENLRQGKDAFAN